MNENQKKKRTGNIGFIGVSAIFGFALGFGFGLPNALTNIGTGKWGKFTLLYGSLRFFTVLYGSLQATFHPWHLFPVTASCYSIHSLQECH